MLIEMAAGLGADLAPSNVDEVREPAADAWPALVEYGLVAMAVPVELGGSGARGIDAALVVEQLASALAPAPFLAAGVWGPALLAAAGAVDAVTAVGSGALRLVPVLRTDLSGLAPADQGGVAFDSRGAGAGLALGSDGRLVAMALGDPTGAVDLTRILRRVAPGDDRGIDVGVALGGVVDADASTRVEALALAGLAADLVGVMQAVVDAAVAYVQERVQFGVPVGSFQAVQHLAAHAKVLLEGSRSSMWHAAWASDALAPAEALMASRQAKAFCSEAGRQVGEIGIQLFGGIGLTWEELAHVRLRRILMSRRILGDEAAQYRDIAIARLGPATLHEVR
jgi:alkylation response protein AidB-like acyl-CoA dehydrogenase